MKNEESVKHRGFMLSLWLWLLFGSNALTFYTYFKNEILPSSQSIFAPLWFILTFLIVSFVHMIALLAIWEWKKIGLYVFVGGSTISGAAALIVGIVSPIALLLSWVFGTGVLMVLVISKWAYFD